MFPIKCRHNILPLVVSVLFASCARESQLELPALISDGMIIQQNSNMKFWGRALPGSHITIHTDWDMTVSATSSPDSLWEVTFPTIAADNKPHQIAISTSDTAIVINDVLLGEVWLASGQSNMLMPVAGWDNDTVLNAQQIIAEANDKSLRMFNVARHISWRKEFEFRGEWKSADPETVKNFSAAAYSFAKVLRDSLKVPVGIINNSVGSSPCEAWVSDTQLKKSVYYGHKVADLAANNAEMDKYISWLHSLPGMNLETNFDHDRRLSAIDVNDEFVTLSMSQFDNWNDMDLPKYWDDDVLGDFDGIVWFVKQIEIPEKWVGKDLSLHLGAVDDCDKTYVNEICIGSNHQTGQYAVERDYTIEGKFIKTPSLTISVRVTDTGGQGGFAGCRGDKMRIQLGKESISLEGPWKFRPAGEFYEDRLVLFDPIGEVFNTRPNLSLYLTHRAPASLYYGMVYPISNYSIAGIIWNQGEANLRHATRYREVFPLLIKSYRDAFNSPKLPFYFAQTPSWTYEGCDSLSLINIREAQRQVANEVQNVAMFSTLDISTSSTPHPCYKEVEGQRYARLALNHTYGYKNVTPSGPVLKSIEYQGQFINLVFDNADGLHIDPLKYGAFEIAGDDEHYFQASAVVRDNVISLFSYAVPEPLYVRYAYRNCSDAAVFNGEGLPAEAFFSGPELKD